MQTGYLLFNRNAPFWVKKLERIGFPIRSNAVLLFSCVVLALPRQTRIYQDIDYLIHLNVNEKL